MPPSPLWDLNSNRWLVEARGCRRIGHVVGTAVEGDRAQDDAEHKDGEPAGDELGAVACGTKHEDSNLPKVLMGVGFTAARHLQIRPSKI